MILCANSKVFTIADQLLQQLDQIYPVTAA
jgi:hypothetical protein